MRCQSHLSIGNSLTAVMLPPHFLPKADSSYYQSTVKRGEAALFFHIGFHHGKRMENVVDAFDGLWGSPDFLWQNQWISDETLVNYISNKCSDTPIINYN